MPLNTGVQIGPYEVLALLGAGGMGEVYRARDTTLKRDVAIKVIPAYWSRDAERLRRFELEAQAAAALNHPNIVSIFHVGQHEGSPYIVTELLQGETLRAHLRHGPMRLREALDFATDVARGLAAAHSAGIVHRDLKPENLFLTRDGRVKILDFGLAKLRQAQPANADGATITLHEETDPGHVLGTAGYMSPEQVRGQPADARSDIFALGAILYEMLTGKRAFQKPTSAETMSAILNEDPPAISQLAPDLPPGLPRIVNRCLEKSPDERFQDASDLAFALEALSDSSSAAIPLVDQAVRRKRWIWITAATAFVLATTAGLIMWLKPSSAVPVVEAVTQLTDDGEPKPSLGKLVTDGARIYFNEGVTGSLKIEQVAVTGGPTAVIPTKLENAQVAGLTHEGSTLLTLVGGFVDLTPAAWTIPLPAGEPRRLGNIEAQDADFFPDGRIIFARGSDLYVAAKDGSSPRKLLSVDGIPYCPSVSPDGQRLVFTIFSLTGLSASLVEAGTDGSGLQPILEAQDTSLFCAHWFGTARGEMYVISMEGGTPQAIAEKNSTSGTWSPDSNLLALTVFLRGNTAELHIFDFRTGKLSVVPSSQGLLGGQWIAQDMLVAAPEPTHKLVAFDFKTQKWSDLVSAAVVNWATSPDYKYLYYTTGGTEPKAMRIRLSDHQTETITSLKDLHRVADWEEQNTQVSVAPDGSAVFTRDIGTQEIYALSVKWP